MTGPPGAGRGDPTARNLLLSAMLANTVVVLPNILLGALAVLVRDDLRFGETVLGVIIAGFAVAATATSAPGGRLSDRVGAVRTMTVGAAIGGAALLGIALLARSPVTLAAFMALAGVGNGLTQPATNGVLSGTINPARQGVAFGLKQASIPLAALLSGLMLPLVAVQIGWRWAFAGAGVVAWIVAASIPRARAAFRARHAAPRPPTDGARRMPLRPLLLITVAVGLASASANVIGAFFVESAVATGVPAGRAGGWLIAGGAAGIVARTTWGWLADRRGRRHLPFVAALMGAGALGLGLLALRPTGGPVLAAATVLAYGAAWGWPGLFNYAIVRQSRAAPAAATGVTQSGIFAGVLVGPPVFGALVEAVSYRAAWTAFSAVLLVAAVLLLTGRAALVRARHAAAGT